MAFAWAFRVSYVFFRALNRVVKLRVSPATELAGPDIPEMGAHGYVPDDLLVPGPGPAAPLPGGVRTPEGAMT